MKTYHIEFYDSYGGEFYVVDENGKVYAAYPTKKQAEDRIIRLQEKDRTE